MIEPIGRTGVSQSLNKGFGGGNAGGRGIGADLENRDLVKEVAAIQTPTFILHGDEDLIPLASAQQIYEAVHGSQLVVLEGIGHIPFAARAEQRGLNFVLSIANLGQRPYLVNGNAAELSQALQNLLDNALKFNQVGGNIALQMTSPADIIVISVEDNGIGVALDEIPLLFQRFYRARNAAAIVGNGLGLAIVKAIVERHGQCQTAYIWHGVCCTIAYRFATICPHQNCLLTIISVMDIIDS